MVEFYFFKKLFFSLQQPVQSGHILQQQWRRGKGNKDPPLSKTQQYFSFCYSFRTLLATTASRMQKRREASANKFLKNKNN